MHQIIGKEMTTVYPKLEIFCDFCTKSDKNNSDYNDKFLTDD